MHKDVFLTILTLVDFVFMNMCSVFFTYFLINILQKRQTQKVEFNNFCEKLLDEFSFIDKKF